MKNDGGPAFPLADWKVDLARGSFISGGMTLRDYFAAAALQGTMKDRENLKALWNSAELEHKEVSNLIAEKMYLLADAMIAERLK
jgi:hypothetical protein